MDFASLFNSSRTAFVYSEHTSANHSQTPNLLSQQGLQHDNLEMRLYMLWVVWVFFPLYSSSLEMTFAAFLLSIDPLDEPLVPICASRLLFLDFPGSSLFSLEPTATAPFLEKLRRSLAWEMAMCSLFD